MTAVETRQFTDTELDRLVEDLNRDGICTLRGLFDPAMIEEWRSAFMQLFQERMAQEGGLAPREKNRYYLTLPWRPPFADEHVFANPTILGVLNRVFAQEYVLVQMGVDVPIKGAEHQEIHRDYRPLFTDDVVTPLYALAVNFPLVEVTDENGPFQQARGTHVMGRDEALDKVRNGDIPMESFYMKPGDVSIRTPLALHRGSPNRSEQPRPMVVMGFVMHWLHTPQVDLRVPRDYYERLPEATRKLLRCEVVERLEESAETYINFKY